MHGVLTTGAIADIDASLVALMGMSSGARVGLQAATADPAERDDGDA